MSALTPEDRAFVEAGVGICMSVIMADAKVSRDESAWWAAKRATHPLFREVAPDLFNTIVQLTQTKLKHEPWMPLVESWAALIPPQFREAVFDLAAELAVIDKELEGKEPEVLRHLWRALSIPDERGRALFMAQIERRMTDG